jgi:hypothetical protein
VSCEVDFAESPDTSKSTGSIRASETSGSTRVSDTSKLTGSSVEPKSKNTGPIFTFSGGALDPDIIKGMGSAKVTSTAVSFQVI